MGTVIPIVNRTEELKKKNGKSRDAKDKDKRQEITSTA